MEKPLISVIVPIYMIDRYIGICIESILNQTYQNLEIILVDDGGRDRCPEICDLYARKDNRIKVIHKSNSGLVSARKAGLQHSNGFYISYVDGDDWIGPGYIEGLYTAATTSDADMVCAGQTRDLFYSHHPAAAFYLGSEWDSLRPANCRPSLRRDYRSDGPTASLRVGFSGTLYLLRRGWNITPSKENCLS